MSYSKLLLSFFLLFFFIAFASSTSSFFNSSSKCSVRQAFVLLQFKKSISSINASQPSVYRGVCERRHPSHINPIMMNWNKHTDCCRWNGITCDHLTGDVVEIDLSCGMLQGTIHLNTTLFHLPRLQRLNLAFNEFFGSQLPREIGRLSNTLTHLNLSECGFAGEIPSEILLLSKLASLDLTESWSVRLGIQNHVLNNLLGNSTHLSELLIAKINISWGSPTYLNISSSLRSVDLSSTNLHRKLPDNIFNLQYLETLDLSDNPLTGALPKVTINQTSLRILKLGGAGLQGKLPDGIFNLQKLEHLDLSRNNITGPLPNFSTGTKIPLKWLDLSSINLSGTLPDSIGHLLSLEHLALTRCGLVGPLPKFLGNLQHLISLDLQQNMLNGTLPDSLFTLPSLEYIFLDGNMFSGGLPSELYNCRSLKVVSLSSNQFDAEINQGSTPPSFIQLINLLSLDLSWNNFTGLWELEPLLSGLPKLEQLSLSYSGLSVVTTNATDYHVNPGFQFLGLASCNLTVFPESLRTMKNLSELDLSNNGIYGQIPQWAGEIGGKLLIELNLSHNSITGLPPFLWVGLSGLYLQSNLIEGPVPPSFCNMSVLNTLDMSNNRFGGVIPECLLLVQMLDLSNNFFHGTIPYLLFGPVVWLILKGNRLEGSMPIRLAHCEDLEILDVGNNHLNDTFPGWLGDLPSLQVLVLKSNNFYGPIDTSRMLDLSFPHLKVLDLSYNGFTGHLPPILFQNFSAMKAVVKNGPNPQYLNYSGLYYSIILVVKGRRATYPQINVDFDIVDLSGNKFEGEIPNAIGSLSSLKALNLSHNNFNGGIPDALGNLSQIESLDLSWNQLTGEIPQSIARLNFLSALNLSQNHLKGRIPGGGQFNTFDETSFGGNSELCGFQLPMRCEHSSSPPQLEGEGGGDEEEEEEEEESGFTWKVVMLGFGCGTLIGLVVGALMLSTGRPKWFNEIADAVEHVTGIGRKKRRIIYIGR